MGRKQPVRRSVDAGRRIESDGCPRYSPDQNRRPSGFSPNPRAFRPSFPGPSRWRRRRRLSPARSLAPAAGRRPATLELLVSLLYLSSFSQLSTSGSSCAAGGGGQRRRFAPSPARCELRPPSPWPVTLELPFFLFFSRHGAMAAMDSSLEVAAPPRAPSPACAPTRE